MHALERYINPVVVGLAALLVAAIVVLAIERRDHHNALEINLASLTPTPGGPIQIYVTGAVARPGVYELADGDRAVDALYEAGGPSPDADLEALNLAVRLHDEDQLVVPRMGESLAAGVQVSSGVTTSGPININTATAEELDAALPGIGEVYSTRIVQSRTTDGPFSTPDDLMVRGLIPRSTFEKIRELITVGP